MPRGNAQQKPQQTAKNNPVRSTRQFVEADEQVTQQKPRVQKSTGPARESLEAAEVLVAERPVSAEKLELLKFMEEELTVQVHETTDETADPVPQIIVDGRSQFFIRGQEQTVKRKYVEVLARAKRTTYKQELVEHPERHYKQIPHTALRFPFSVTHDPSGDKGRKWLQKILAEK